MKKATLQFIATYLSENTQYADDNEKSALESALTEINAELNKGAEAKAEAAKEYEAAKAIVMSELGETPVTIGELFDAIGDKLPEGFTKGKLQYAMTRLWKDELVKTEGKVNSYSKA